MLAAAAAKTEKRSIAAGHKIKGYLGISPKKNQKDNEISLRINKEYYLTKGINQGPNVTVELYHSRLIEYRIRPMRPLVYHTTFAMDVEQKKLALMIGHSNITL